MSAVTSGVIVLPRAVLPLFYFLNSRDAVSLETNSQAVRKVYKVRVCGSESQPEHRKALIHFFSRCLLNTHLAPCSRQWGRGLCLVNARVPMEL